MIGNAFAFNEAFFEARQREAIEYDPIGTDDGILRRWVACGLAHQLLPVTDVGVSSQTTKRDDPLWRPPRNLNLRPDSPEYVERYREQYN